MTFVTGDVDRPTTLQTPIAAYVACWMDRPPPGCAIHTQEEALSIFVNYQITNLFNLRSFPVITPKMLSV